MRAMKIDVSTEWKKPLLRDSREKMLMEEIGGMGGLLRRNGKQTCQREQAKIHLD